MNAKNRKNVESIVMKAEEVGAKLREVMEAIQEQMGLAEILDQTRALMTELRDAQEKLAATSEQEQERFDALSESRQEAEEDEFSDAESALADAISTLEEAADNLEGLRDTLAPCLPREKKGGEA